MYNSATNTKEVGIIMDYFVKNCLNLMIISTRQTADALVALASYLQGRDAGSNNAQPVSQNEQLYDMKKAPVEMTEAEGLEVIVSKPKQVSNEQQTEEKGSFEITQEDLKKMPKNITKGKILAGGFSVGWRKLQSGKNSYTYNVRFKREGYNIDFCDQHKENLKPRFLEELKNQSSQKQKESKSGVPITFNRFSLYYFDNFRIKKVVEETFKKDMSRYNKHLAPYFKETLIKNITPSQCQNLLDQVPGNGKTADEVYSLMNGIFGYAIAHHIIPFSPMDTVLHIQHIRESGKALTKAEERLLLQAAAKTEYLIAFAIALYTGLRPNEYRSVRIVGRFIMAINSKRHNGKVEYKKIPISPMLRPYLEGITEVYFPCLRYMRDKVKEVLPNHKLYDLRTTFYTRCDECGVAAPARDEFMGHSNSALTKAYRDLSDEYLLKESEKLKY